MYTKESVVVSKCIICDKNICNLGDDFPVYNLNGASFNSLNFNLSDQGTIKNTLNLTEDNLFVTIPRTAIALQYNGPEDINKIIDILEKIWYKHSEYQVAYSPIGNVISINTPNKHLKIHLGEILVLYNTYDSLEVLTETKFKQKFMCKSQH